MYSCNVHYGFCASMCGQGGIDISKQCNDKKLIKYIDSWVSSKSDKKNLTRFALKALTRLMNMIFGAVLGYSGYIYKRCRSIYVLWCLYFPNGDDKEMEMVYMQAWSKEIVCFMDFVE